MLRRFRLAACAVLLSAALSTSVAQADVWGDVGIGLDFAGFQFVGQRNPLSQGLSLQTARNFQNTPLDFGTSLLTLTGPVNAQFTTSNRGIRRWDFTMAAGSATNPLLYTLESGVGSTQVRVDGSTVFNATGSIDQFGWYDLQFQWSNRQTSSSDGRFANLDDELADFDIGPIDVSGNLFADLLAVVADPFFEAAGYENIFASFSGRTARENTLESTVAQLREKAAAGLTLSRREVRDLVRMAAEGQVHGDTAPDLGFLNGADIGASGGGPDSLLARVPEPATVLLMLLPAAVYLRRRR